MSELKSRIQEILNNEINKQRTGTKTARPNTRDKNEEDDRPESKGKYYYDTFKYSSIHAANVKAESVFDAQNTKLLGIPHQFLPNTDFRIDSSNNFGYCFAKDIFMERPVVTMMPGKVNYLPDMSAADKKAFASLSGDIDNSNSKKALDELISESAETRYYDFACDYSQYIRYVNLLCRVAAAYLGIENLPGPDGKTRYIDYDWANYQSFNNYSTPVKDDKGVLTVIKDIAEAISDSVNTLKNDIFAGYRQYVHFYVDPSTSVNENMSNTTQKSQLEGAFDTAEGVIKEATMLLQSVSDAGAYAQQFLTTAGEGIISLANTATLGLFKNMLGLAEKEVLHGANLIYPEIWMDSDYSKSYTVQMNLVSPYGDKEAIYLNIMVPLLHALCMSLPRQSSANSFSSPFIIRAYCKGWFSCDMGMVESITIDKGPEQSWTVDGLPSQVKITMTIKDLYSQLMISPSNKPSLFFSNQGMMDYLGSMCGVDLTVPNIIFKLRTVRALLAGINDIPNNIYRDMTQNLYNILQKFTS